MIVKNVGNDETCDYHTIMNACYHSILSCRGMHISIIDFDLVATAVCESVLSYYLKRTLCVSPA